jgi:hypothetical protein
MKGGKTMYLHSDRTVVGCILAQLCKVRRHCAGAARAHPPTHPPRDGSAALTNPAQASRSRTDRGARAACRCSGHDNSEGGVQQTSQQTRYTRLHDCKQGSDQHLVG